MARAVGVVSYLSWTLCFVDIFLTFLTGGCLIGAFFIIFLNLAASEAGGTPAFHGAAAYDKSFAKQRLRLGFLRHSFRQADSSRGTDKPAEMAAHALCADDVRLSRIGVEGNSLMATVGTRDRATSAANASLAVKLRKHDAFAIEMIGPDKLADAFAHQFGQVANASLCHVMA